MKQMRQGTLCDDGDPYDYEFEQLSRSLGWDQVRCEAVSKDQAASTEAAAETRREA